MQSASVNRDYPLADRVHLTFDRVEDRIALALDRRSGERKAAWLTRRVFRQLLDVYAARLGGTSEAAAHAPAAQRDEVLQMEHASAVAARRQERPASKPASAASSAAADEGASFGPPDHLVTRVHVGNRGRRLVVAFDGVVYPLADGGDTEPAALGVLVLDRVRAHQFLDILRAKGREAEWGLPQPPEWTGRIQRPRTATN